MKLDKLIFLIYAVLTLIALLCVSVTTANLMDVIPGVMYMWMCLAFFYLATRDHIHFCIKGFDNYRNEKYMFRNKRFVVGMVCIIGVAYSAYFYSGSRPSDVINSLLNEKSLYIQYQEYFAMNKLATMAISKIPVILINIFVEFTMLYSFIFVVLIDEKIRTKNLILAIFAAGAKLYFGIARGTNFEMFELAFLLLFCFWQRKSRSTTNIVRIFTISIGIMACVVIFMIVLSSRGVKGTEVYISQGIHTDNTSVFVQSFPVMAKIIAWLGAYFSFGLFHISIFMVEFMFDCIPNFLMSIVPLGSVITGTNIISEKQFEKLSENVCWTPDLMLLVGLFGMFIGPISFYLLGQIYYRLFKMIQIYPSDVYARMLLFIVVYQLFAMPVGNFVWISSATRMTTFLLVLVLFIRKKGMQGLSTGEIRKEAASTSV